MMLEIARSIEINNLRVENMFIPYLVNSPYGKHALCVRCASTLRVSIRTRRTSKV
jgi:hypothetical protein